MKRFSDVFALIVLVFCVPSIAFAAHPLITDDTGTQGFGKFQLEMNAEIGRDRAHEDGVTVKETSGELAASISAGLSDRIDLVFEAPYPWTKVTVEHEGEHVGGIGDLSVELKWRFYELNGLSLAIKPGITIPVGDEREGQGTGRLTYGAFLITQTEAGPWTFLLNLGYVRNCNSVGDRTDLWHGSAAAEYAVGETLKLVGNVGIETNPDPSGNTPPTFGLGGIVFAVAENVDVDFGVKAGLSRPETDISLLAGIAWRF